MPDCPGSSMSYKVHNYLWMETLVADANVDEDAHERRHSFTLALPDKETVINDVFGRRFQYRPIPEMAGPPEVLTSKVRMQASSCTTLRAPRCQYGSRSPTLPKYCAAFWSLHARKRWCSSAALILSSWLATVWSVVAIFKYRCWAGMLRSSRLGLSSKSARNVSGTVHSIINLHGYGESLSISCICKWCHWSTVASGRRICTRHRPTVVDVSRGRDSPIYPGYYS